MKRYQDNVDQRPHPKPTKAEQLPDAFLPMTQVKPADRKNHENSHQIRGITRTHLSTPNPPKVKLMIRAVLHL